MNGEYVALICDGSYDGFLTALFDAHTMTPPPADILIEEPAQRDMTLTYLRSGTDAAKARRLQTGIERKLSPESPWRVECLWRSAIPGGGRMCFDYLRLGWEWGATLDEHVQVPLILEVEKNAKRVGHEIHLFRGLMRFAQVEGGVYYAKYEPDSHITDVLAEHFLARMSDVPWIIHDLRRGVCAAYDTRRVRFMDAGNLTPPSETDEERFAVALWQAFHAALAIAARENPRTQAQHMPRRYWKHLPEMQKKTRTAGGLRPPRPPQGE